MACASFGFFTQLAILVITGILVLAGDKVTAQCELSIPSLVSECSEYVKTSGPKIPPSQSCCEVVKRLDLPCLCKLVPPDVEKLVSMDKVVFVAQSCGLLLQPGMKCGSFVVPPPV